LTKIGAQITIVDRVEQFSEGRVGSMRYSVSKYQLAKASSFLFDESGGRVTKQPDLKGSDNFPLSQRSSEKQQKRQGEKKKEERHLSPIILSYNILVLFHCFLPQVVTSYV
jgi:hypothetical protein